MLLAIPVNCALHGLNQWQARLNPQHCTCLSDLKGQPASFVWAFGAIAPSDLPHAIGALSELHDFAHGCRFMSLRAKVVGTRHARLLPELLGEFDVAGNRFQYMLPGADGLRAANL